MVSLLLLAVKTRKEFLKSYYQVQKLKNLILPPSLSPSNQNRHLGLGKLGDIFQLGTQILVLAG